MSRFERWSRAKRGLPAVSDEDTPSVETPSVEKTATSADDDKAHLDASEHVRQQAEGDEVGGAADESRDALEAPPEPGSLDHTLPDPDTLAAGSDFSAFMSPGVSSALRRKALRRLWSTGDYNVRDGLNDYDHDFKAQMKPMAAEMVDKVRQWTKKVEDALDDKTADQADSELKPTTTEPSLEDDMAMESQEKANDNNSENRPTVEQHDHR
ncbi:DUF3306 domain-containing protein [Halomonas llamarensis]|uniref:DUF3306 domain-containing protein n=1 Tax=Halomonas llamarensis TaxID=2945104 RepID=A0ABT0SN31_9GAMM|nr:DUF3306 domain-containing protein [Halomonas llamarensis]MCL7929176.1 DUF3306 domain-containing protein [Halomonas llamarensis]